MIYTQEVENMCPVAQGVHHGAAPVPTEGKWVQNKEKTRLKCVRLENPVSVATSVTFLSVSLNKRSAFIMRVCFKEIAGVNPSQYKKLHAKN